MMKACKWLFTTENNGLPVQGIFKQRHTAGETEAKEGENVAEDNGSLTPVWPEMSTGFGKA